MSALIVHRSTDTILLFSIFLIPRQPAAAGITTCYHRLKKTVPHYLLLSPLLQHSQQPGSGELETTGNGAHLRLPTLASVPMVRCPAPGVPGPAGGGRGRGTVTSAGTLGLDTAEQHLTSENQHLR